MRAARALSSVRELATLATGDEEEKTVASCKAGIERWIGFYDQYRQLAEAGKFLEGNDLMQGSIYPILAENDKATAELVTGRKRRWPTSGHRRDRERQPATLAGDLDSSGRCGRGTYHGLVCSPNDA